METMISVYDFFKIFQSDTSLKIIDVRNKQKYDDYHIPGAICLPGFSAIKQSGLNLVKDEIYYVIDYDGELTLEITNDLNKLGYHAFCIFGGIKRWQGNLV